MPKPVIAAVNGVAAGAGASLAFACDFRILADTAGFNLAFTGIGLSCDTGASWMLPRLVGRAKAIDLLYFPRTWCRGGARRWAWPRKVVPADELAATPTELAAHLATGPTVAFGAVRRAIEFSAGNDFESSLAFEAEMMKLSGRTQDHADAVRVVRRQGEARSSRAVDTRPRATAGTILDAAAGQILPAPRKTVKMIEPTSRPTWARIDRPGPSPQVSVVGPVECLPCAGSHRASSMRPAMVVTHQKPIATQPTTSWVQVQVDRPQHQGEVPAPVWTLSVSIEIATRPAALPSSPCRAMRSRVSTTTTAASSVSTTVMPLGVTGGNMPYSQGPRRGFRK